MKRFDDQYLSGWHDSSDPDIARLLQLARQDLNRAEQKRRSVQQRYARMVDRVWDISDRH